MRLIMRLLIVVCCTATWTGAVGLDSGGQSGISEQHVLKNGSLGGSFSGVISFAGSYRLTSSIPYLPITAEVVGDFNADGVVDFSDFLLFAQVFGLSQGQPKFESRFDLDANGQIAFGDFLIFAAAFGS